MDTPIADVDDSKVLGLEAAPEFLVEGYRGAAMRAGIVKLNFFTNVFNASDRSIRKRAALTMAVPYPDFEQIVSALVSLREELQAAQAKAEAVPKS
jgi:hypothetical protein